MPRSVKPRVPRETRQDKAWRLYEDRHGVWLYAHRRGDGRPFFILPGSELGTVHYTDMLFCTCPAQRQWAKRDRDDPCSHILAVRTWWQEGHRTGRWWPHPSTSDRQHFQAQTNQLHRREADLVVDMPTHDDQYSTGQLELDRAEQGSTVQNAPGSTDQTRSARAGQGRSAGAVSPAQINHLRSGQAESAPGVQDTPTSQITSPQIEADQDQPARQHDQGTPPQDRPAQRAPTPGWRLPPGAPVWLEAGDSIDGIVVGQWTSDDDDDLDEIPPPTGPISHLSAAERIARMTEPTNPKRRSTPSHEHLPPA